jgi:hypothetical protein
MVRLPGDDCISGGNPISQIVPAVTGIVPGIYLTLALSEKPAAVIKSS